MRTFRYERGYTWKEEKGKERNEKDRKDRKTERSRTLEVPAVPCVCEAEAPAPRQPRLNLAADSPEDVFSDLKDGRFDQESVEGRAVNKTNMHEQEYQLMIAINLKVGKLGFSFFY